MRSRRILDREKTHELKKYSSACYFLNNTSSRDYKHNVTRVSDSENLVLASGRTVAPTRVVGKVHSGEVKFGFARQNSTVFFQFWGRLSSFHFSTVDVTHTGIRHCSPLCRNQVFSIRKTCAIIYSNPRSGITEKITRSPSEVTEINFTPL